MPRKHRISGLIALLVLTIAGAWIATAQESPEPRQGWGVERGPTVLQPPSAVYLQGPVYCLASQESEVCAQARRLAQLTPCTSPEDCQALNLWQEMAGEPRAELALGEDLGPGDVLDAAALDFLSLFESTDASGESIEPVDPSADTTKLPNR